jgi:hypothetical protein
MALKRRGYAAVAASRLSELRRALFGGRPALAMIEIDHRGRSLALARRARRRRPELHVLYTSGLLTEFLGLTPEERACLLTKPYTAAQVAQATAALLKTRPGA